MTQARFQTMRHIETVRNYISLCIKELLDRQMHHDQSKLEGEECEAFEVLTERLHGLTYGSEEYKSNLRQYAPAIQHHYKNNRHHPEHFPDGGILKMNLIDLLEMLCDWKSASLRHADGDIWRSLDINKERFGYDEQLHIIFQNTVQWLESQTIYHKAEES